MIPDCRISQAGAAALMLLLAACSVTPANDIVTGSVTYRERMALPDDAVLTVSLLDVSLADAPATTVAETTFTANGRQVPIDFTLEYQPTRIDSSHRYVVRSTIHSDGTLLFTTDRAYPVITNDAPTSVELMLVRVAAMAVQPNSFPSRAGRLVLAAEALHFIPCGEAGPGILVDDQTDGYAATIVRQLGGEGAELAALVILDGTRLNQVRYAGLEGPRCEELLGDADVVARGNEPFWHASIDAGFLVIRTPEDSGSRYAGQGWSQPAEGRWRYDASRSVGGSVERVMLELVEDRCVDSMSGAHYPFAASLSRNGTIMGGCAVEGRSVE